MTANCIRIDIQNQLPFDILICCVFLLPTDLFLSWSDVHHFGSLHFGSFLHIFQMCIILLAKWCLLSEMDISYRNETRTCAYFKRQRNTKNALLFHNTIYYMMIKLKERLTKFSVSRIKYFWFSLKWWTNSRGENPPSQLQYLRNPFDSFVFQ